MQISPEIKFLAGNSAEANFIVYIILLQRNSFSDGMESGARINPIYYKYELKVGKTKRYHC